MLKYLWQSRCRPPVGSRLWAKQWARRFWTAPTLLAFSLRAFCLKRRGVTIGEGSVLSPLLMDGKGYLLGIGKNSFVGRIKIQLQAKVTIGSNVCLNDGVTLLTASHDVRDSHWQQFAKPIQILDHAWVATGATLLPGVTIGKGAIVGAFAVVTRDVPDYSVATGNPARIRENIRCRDLDYSPVQFLAFQTAWLGLTK